MPLIPAYDVEADENDESPFRLEPEKLPPVSGLSELWWPDERLERAMLGRDSIFRWRRRRAIRACRWLIIRREVRCGLREMCAVEIVLM